MSDRAFVSLVFIGLILLAELTFARDVSSKSSSSRRLRIEPQRAVVLALILLVIPFVVPLSNTALGLNTLSYLYSPYCPTRIEILPKWTQRRSTT